MKKSIFNFRTDLAIETIEQVKETDIFKHIHKTYEDINIDYVKIIKKQNQLNKAVGDYITIDFNDSSEEQQRIDIIDVLETNLGLLLEPLNLTETSKVLVVGLGNRDVTADALGPIVASQTIVTSHIFELAPEALEENQKRVSVIAPGVMGQTGIETSDVISAIVKKIKPDCVIVIDALASRRSNRINKTIQLTNTGISPGSGVGNNRKELNMKTLKVPVIAIGVPTVIEVSSLAYDTFELVEKHLLDVYDFKYDKLDINRRDIIQQVLQEADLNMIVTVKHIDEEIMNLASIISHSINNILHS